MRSEDQAVLNGLFGRLADAEAQAPARDAAAEAFIRDRVAKQPASAYYMAQTIVMQEQALNHAQQRLEALEAELAQRQQPASGGLFGGLFGGSSPQPSRPAQPRHGMGAPSTFGGAQAHPQQGAGGGFMAGAAQTAMGVAGGMLLANALGDMFGGEAAAAAETLAEDAGVDVASLEDAAGGFDMGDMEI